VIQTPEVKDCTLPPKVAPQPQMETK